MARPKSVKNKTAEAPKPAEFNYEDSDSLYQQVMSNGAVAPIIEDPANVLDDVTARREVPAVNVSLTQPIPLGNPSIFLVEGKVRLDQSAAAPIVAEQRRLVVANNVDEALAKFSNYFTSMSGPSQRYTIVQAAASETIQ